MLQTSEWALSEWKETAEVERKGMDKKKNWIQYVAKHNGKQREREREECTLQEKRRVGLSDKVII